jgi:hypothetical protein
MSLNLNKNRKVKTNIKRLVIPLPRLEDIDLKIKSPVQLPVSEGFRPEQLWKTPIWKTEPSSTQIEQPNFIYGLQKNNIAYKFPLNKHQNYLATMPPCIFSPLTAPITYIRTPNSPMMQIQNIGGYGDFSFNVNNFSLLPPSQLFKKYEDIQLGRGISPSFTFMHDFQGK